MNTPTNDSRAVARPWWRSRAAQIGLSVAVVALIFGFFFPKVADYGEVWKTITAMTLIELVTLGAVAAWNLVSYWPMLTSVQPGLRVREAAVANLASTAVANTLPGGGALGVGVTMTMQRSWGIPVASTALATVVSGIWNNFVKLGLPVVALGLLAVSGGASGALMTAASAANPASDAAIHRNECQRGSPRVATANSSIVTIISTNAPTAALL